MATKRRSKKKAPARKRRTAYARRPASRKKTAPARRRRRSNPKGLFAQPAVKFAAIAGAGALAASWVNSNAQMQSTLAPFTFEGKMQASTVAGIATLGLGWWFFKGKNRQLALAAGVGMLLPQASTMLTQSSTTSALTGRRSTRPAALQAPRRKSPAATVHHLNTDLIGA